MTNSLRKAGKRLFAHDPDVRRYAAADTAYDDDDEYVPEHTEDRDERADADRRKVPSLILSFFPLQHTHPAAKTRLPLPPLPTHSFAAAAANAHLLHIHSVTSSLASRKEMLPFYTL